MKSFGTLIRRLRADQPVAEFAARLGVPKSYIANLEAGRKNPTEKQARRILEVGFQLTPEESTRCLLHVLLFDYGIHSEVTRDLLIQIMETAKAQSEPGLWLNDLSLDLERRVRRQDAAIETAPGREEHRWGASPSGEADPAPTPRP